MPLNWRMMIIKLCKNLWTSRVFVLAWLHFTRIPWARRMHQKNLTIQYGGLELELYLLLLESVWEINCRQNIPRIIFVSSPKNWCPKIASKLNASQAKETQLAQNRQYLRPECTTSRKSSQEHIGLWHWGTIIAIDSIVTKIQLHATALPTKSHVWIETAILEGPIFQLHYYVKGELRSNESLASEVPSQYQSPLKVSRFLVGDPPTVEGVHPNV